MVYLNLKKSGFKEAYNKKFNKREELLASHYSAASITLNEESKLSDEGDLVTSSNKEWPTSE